MRRRISTWAIWLLCFHGLGCGDDDGPPVVDDAGIDTDATVDDGGLDASPDAPADSGPADLTPPEIVLHFPSPVSRVASATLLVRGVARDEGGVASVRVNDVVATLEGTAFEATVPLSPGANTITIRAIDEVGNVTAEPFANVTREGTLGTLFSLDVDPAGAVYGVDHLRNEVVQVDPTTGRVLWVSSNVTSTENPLGGAIGLAYDARRMRILVANREPAQVLVVDPTTGARTVLANGTVSDSATPLRLPSRITVDAEGDRAFLLETDAAGNDGRLLAVALETGTLTTVATDVTSPSLPFSGATAMDFDLASGRVIVMNRNVDAVFSVSPSDGSTRLVSDNFSPTMGAGVAPFTNTVSLRIDATLGVAYAHEIEHRQILAVDLSTGERRTVAEVSVGDEPLLDTRDFVIDGDRLVVFETADPRVVALDLATGARTEIGDSSFPPGSPRLANAEAFAFEPTRGRWLIATGETLVTLDLATGEREVFVDDLDYVATVDFDESRDRWIAFDGSLGLFAIDPDDGAVTVLSSDDRGDGEPLSGVLRVMVDSARDRYLAATVDALLAIDPESGDRTPIESGPTIADPAYDVALDASRDRVLALATVASTTGVPSSWGLVAIDVRDGTQTLLDDSRTEGFALGYGLEVRGDVVWAGGSREGLPTLVSHDLVTSAQLVEPFPEDGMPRGVIGRLGVARASDGYERLYALQFLRGRVEILQIDPSTRTRVVVAR